MSLQSMLNKELIDKLPIIRITVELADPTTANSMVESTVRKAMNCVPCVDDMNPTQLYEFQASLMGFFRFKEWIK